MDSLDVYVRTDTKDKIMENYDFYRQVSIQNFLVDILVDLKREKIILQFGDDCLVKFLESFEMPLKNYMNVRIEEGDIM